MSQFFALWVPIVVGVISRDRSSGIRAKSVFAPYTLEMFSLVVGLALVEKTETFFLVGS